MIFANPGGHAVVGNHPQFVGQHGVSRFSDGLFGEAEGIQPVHKLRGVRPAQLNAAERTDVDNAHLCSDCVDLLLNCGSSLLLGAIKRGSLPITCRHHLCAQV